MAYQATDGQPVLQVPRHEFRVVDDGSRETVEITVQLPGVSSAADISVRIEPPQTVTVTVPSRYHLQLVLAVPIASRADTVKFKSKTGRLNMSCRVLTPEEAKAAAAAAAAAGGGAGVPNGNGALGSSSSGGNSSSGALRGVTSDTAQLVSSSSGLSARSSLTGDGSSHGGAAAAAVPPPTPPPPFGSSSSSGVSGSSTWQPSPTPPWHQQQQQQPVPARPSPPRQQPPPQQQQQPSPPPPRQQQRQQQSPGGVHESFFPQPTKAELRRQQLEEQRRQQEEEQRRREQEAAAAAAAEAQRQREEAAAARRAAEERKRQEAQRKAAARAAAAEEAQRKEQQRRLNKAAAEEWLSRGHAAIAQEDLEVAAKALSKARELDPTNKDGLHRLNKELAALRQQKAAAAAAAGSRRSGSSGDAPPPPEQQPGPGPSSSSSNGPQQQPPPPQQQQQRRPPWRERRRAVGHGVRDEKTRDMLDKWCEGGHAGGPVGWWCGCVDVLCYWVTWLGAVIAEWAAGLPARDDGWGLARGAFVWVVGMAGTLVMFVPALLLILWHLAWSKPLGLVAAVRRVGGDSHLESVEWMMRWQASLSTKEDLSSGLTKAALAGCSGGAAYAAVWCSCLLPLGSHSLVGWLLALLGWVWRLLLWSPSYTLQFVAAAAGTGFCSYTQPGPCVLALFPLQVLVGGGRWTTLANLAGSILYGLAFRDWRPSWREVSSSPPWWQCVAVAALPTLVLRSLSRAGISRLFWALLWLLARLAGRGVAAVGSGLGAAVGVEGPLSFLQALGDTLGPAISWAQPAVRPAAWAASKALAALASLAVRTLPAPTTLSLSAWAVGSVCHKPVPAFWKGPCRVVLKAGLLESMGVGNGTATAGAAGAAGAAAGVSSLGGGFPHAWWLDVLLFVWLFYVTAVYTKWEEEFGRNFYREQQQEQQQRRRQQQQRGHHAAGSDDEADHTPWGDKQSDFPMGFGAVAVPAGCEVAEVKAVLAATDYYKVMGYASREEVTAESLKTKRRQLVLAVHPDKVGHDYPGANQAAGRVNKAFETLSDPGMRSAYDSILANHSRGRAGGFRPAGGAAGAGGAGGGSEAWAGEYRDDLYDRPSPTDNMFMVQDMGCPGCGGQHTAYILPKAPFGVRWCVDCKTWHPVAKGEIWAHWSPGPMGMSWLGGARLLLCADPEGPVYDVTEVFRCKDAGGILPRSQEFCNRHINQYMAAGGGGSSRGYAGGGGGGGGGTSTARRSRKKGKRR